MDPAGLVLCVVPKIYPWHSVLHSRTVSKSHYLQYKNPMLDGIKAQNYLFQTRKECPSLFIDLSNWFGHNTSAGMAPEALQSNKAKLWKETVDGNNFSRPDRLILLAAHCQALLSSMRRTSHWKFFTYTQIKHIWKPGHVFLLSSTALASSPNHHGNTMGTIQPDRWWRLIVTQTHCNQWTESTHLKPTPLIFMEFSWRLIFIGLCSPGFENCLCKLFFRSRQVIPLSSAVRWLNSTINLELVWKQLMVWKNILNEMRQLEAAWLL